MADFYIPPRKDLEQGDIFKDVPFSAMLYPFSFFRVNPKDKSINHYAPDDVAQVKSDDSPKSSVGMSTVILLSHGCEIEKVIKDRGQRRRPWLAAPIERLATLGEKTQQRTRDSQQPNRFYLRVGDYLGNHELVVDLRKITTVRAQYFIEGNRVCSISDAAQNALRSQLGVFFSGWALYIQTFACSTCGTEIDPRDFVVASGDEPDVD